MYEIHKVHSYSKAPPVMGCFCAVPLHQNCCVATGNTRRRDMVAVVRACHYFFHIHGVCRLGMLFRLYVELV